MIFLADENAFRPEAAPETEAETASPKEAAAARMRDDGRALIKVIGVGGGGGNAVNRMIEAGVAGVEFIAANTDAQVLSRSLAPTRIQLGRDRTGGLGCGGDPEVGRLAARDDMDTLIDALKGADMVFIAAGEGGGTGTGATPVVACVAQEIKALCVAVVTKPLGVEGRRRRETADEGIRELRDYVDTLICVPNDRVVQVYGDKPIRDAFRDADAVVTQAVQGISDLIQIPGEINLDFADVRMAMRQRGAAVMGIGTATGENRVEEATKRAIQSPLLEDTSIRGASSIIINVTGGESMTLKEVQTATERVREAVQLDEEPWQGEAPGDTILLGTAFDPSLQDAEKGDAIRVTVVVTGFPERGLRGSTPQDLATYVERRATGTTGAAPEEPEETPAVRRRSPRRRKRARGAGGPSLFGNGSPEPTADAEPASAGASRRVEADIPPVLPPDDRGDDRWGSLDPPPPARRSGSDSRWGDLDTPPYLKS